MEFLVELWKPIFASAIFVWIASSVLHMLFPIHKGDCSPLPNEAEMLAAMRAQGLKPGEYMFPACESMKDMGSEEMVEKYHEGPVGFMAVLPNGPPAIGKSLVQWFVYSLLISVFAAYLAWHVMGPGAPYMDVFRLTGTVAVLAYGVANIPNSIWKGVRWRVTFKFIFDGVIYGLLTAGAFGWLWPSAI